MPLPMRAAHESSSDLSTPREIVRLAARGDGVTADGHFVPLAAPGDLAIWKGERWIVSAGPLRAVPPCRHFPDCGGCHLQHIDDQTYTAWMQSRIIAALSQAGVSSAEIMPPHLSPPLSRRRASLKAVRAGGRIVIGFHVEGTHRILDMRECHVLRPELFALVEPLRDLLAAAMPSGQGAGVTLTQTDSGIDLMLANIPVEAAAARKRLVDFAQAQDLARLSVETAAGVELVALRRPPSVTMGGVTVAIPPASFLQATGDGEEALVAAVLAEKADARRVADLFSGIGTFTLPLAARGARVTAADASGPAISALAAAAAGKPIEALHRDLYRRPLRPEELKRFDAVVFDPPRAGAKEQALEIARSTVPLVVAVSCNPATFARDAAILAEGGFRLGRVWPVGQFRWSNHVELVASFAR